MLSMPRLILLRHAKSDWNTSASSDHARPLSGRGRRDAPRIGAALAARGWVPEVVLSSDATRTRQTWEGMRAVLAPEAPVRWCHELYLASAGSAAGLLAAQTAQTVMLIGHNPGLEELVQQLAGEPERMTTCNAALLVHPQPWPQAMADGAALWRLEAVIRPREPRS